jgi:hypothetical protein
MLSTGKVKKTSYTTEQHPSDDRPKRSLIVGEGRADFKTTELPVVDVDMNTHNNDDTDEALNITMNLLK